MRILLDTHVLLWALAQPHRLDEDTRATIESGASDVLFSVASIWEIAIKTGIGRRSSRRGAAALPPRSHSTAF